jgi:hypothetical protein
MFVHYSGKTFTATRTGTRIVPVICEKCRTSFYYELARVGVGKGSAPYHLGQKSAADRAARAAERDLARRLERDVDLVACPKCKWVNEELVRRYRARMYRRAPWLIVCLVVGGLVIAPLMGALVAALFGDDPVPAAVLSTMALFLLSPIWVLLIRSRLRHRIDPNATYPRKPTLPPGTPPALVERRDPKTGEVDLVPVADAKYAPPNVLDWAVVRPGQFRLIPLCCMCLDNARTTYRPPLKTNDTSELAVPLCPTCQRKLTWKWWRTLLVVAVVMLGISAATALTIPKIDAIGRWMLFSIMGFFLSLLFGVVIASQFARPYKIKTIDRARGVFRFSAANPRYTALLAAEIREREFNPPV